MVHLWRLPPVVRAAAGYLSAAGGMRATLKCYTCDVGSTGEESGSSRRTAHRLSFKFSTVFIAHISADLVDTIVTM